MIKAGQEISVQVADHCMVTIQRPDGSTETLRHPKIAKMTDALLRQVNAAMAAAGKGKITVYRNVTRAATYTATAADEATDTSARIERAMQE